MNIEEKVLSIIRANTEEAAQVRLQSDLRQELRLDSFGTLMVINALEDAFGIALEDGEFSRVRTVADVVAVLQSKYHCA
jgi:acyl carrier protein